MPDGSYEYDVIVIGAGPGGYVAAIRAAQLGAKTLCIEKEYLGGTCLNWGCIPSKALIASAETYQHAQHMQDVGVIINGTISFDFAKIMERKQKIVETLRGGVGMLFKKNGVKLAVGTASFKDAHTVTVTSSTGTEDFTGRSVIIATGSKAIKLPIPGLENAPNVWTSDDALSATAVPGSMLVVGAGAVGLEFAYIYSSLGAKVTVVEVMDRVLPLFDEDISKESSRVLGKQGIKILTGAKLEKTERSGDKHVCHVTTASGSQTIEADVVLLGVGRRSVVDGMNLENIGVETNKAGITVKNDKMQTSVPHIYAIGDVKGNYQLAHVASAEGIVAASNAMGIERKMDYRSVPNCVYFQPEVASVGLTEAQAKEKGYDVRVGKFQFRPLGRSMAANEKDGFVKVVSEAKYDELLGVHIIGPHATDLIHEAAAAIKLEATVDYMIDTIHAHPTFAEALLEAYEDAHGQAIHKV